jgi:hypothetical protein
MLELDGLSMRGTTMVFLVGIFVFLAANDTCSNGNGGTRETVGRRDRRGESPSLSDETLSGQIQTDGRTEARLHYVGRTQNLPSESKKLL